MALTRVKSQLMSALGDRSHAGAAGRTKFWRRRKTSISWRLLASGAGGVPLAQRLAGKIAALEQREVPVGILDISLYRDDLSTIGLRPVLNGTDIPFSVQGKGNHPDGRCALHGTNHPRRAGTGFSSTGAPRGCSCSYSSIGGHRELPIEARFIGRTVQTTDDEIIEVKFQEIDDMEKVLLVERSNAEAA